VRERDFAGIAPDDALVADVARLIVVQTAPEELPLFRSVSNAYFEAPDRVLRAQKRKDDMLGFGAEAALVLVTPVALDVAKTVLRFLAAQVAHAFEKESSDAIDRRVHRLFHGDEVADTEADGATRLSADQLKQVHDLALEKARQLELGEPQAALLADALVGSLSAA